jgi:hypothetical protein
MRIEEDDFNRIIGLYLEMDPSLLQYGENAIPIIERKLHTLTLKITCCKKVVNSYSHQASLLTTINCGKRCFKGGVFIELEADGKCLLPGFEKFLLSKAIQLLGGKVSRNYSSSFTKHLIIGGLNTINSDAIYLHHSSWRGGFSDSVEKNFFDLSEAFPLGAIASATLAVASSFLSATGLNILADKIPTGLSLWDAANLNWLDSKPAEPMIECFPEKLWLLGLGHLGQAYAWTLGLLPFKKSNPFQVTLQDFDVVKKANYEAGMFSEPKYYNIKKARVIAEHLERSGIKTTIVERRYNERFVRDDEDPYIMLSGLDNVKTRRQLRVDDFHAILDFGLGGNSGTFDLIRFRNLPLAGTPKELWQEDDALTNDALLKLTEKINGCGYVKGVAVSFVGVLASCFAIAELLKSYHGGNKIISANISLRQFLKRRIETAGLYKNELFCGQVDFG